MPPPVGPLPYVPGGGAPPVMAALSTSNPTAPFSPSYITQDVLLFANKNVYRVRPSLSQDTTLHAPFFGL